MRFAVNVMVILASALVAAANYGSIIPNETREHFPLTSKNLDTAMHGEAFAHAKYLLFAQHAREAGHPEVAKVFESAAQSERLEHFAEEAGLSGMISSDEQNLREAIRGESYEAEHMYPTMAKAAASEGFEQAARIFEKIGRDEMRHRAEFQAALDALTGHGVSGHQ